MMWSLPTKANDKHLVVQFHQTDSISATASTLTIDFDRPCEELFSRVLAKGAPFRNADVRAWEFWTKRTDPQGQVHRVLWDVDDQDKPQIAHWHNRYPCRTEGSRRVVLFGRIRDP